MHLHRLIAVIYCLSFVACHGDGDRRETNTADNEQKHCFLRLEGSQLQDSSYIQLVTRNGTVTGIYNVIPYEKDARRGTVLGKLKDDVFDLVWTFSQEGRQDTLRVVFKRSNGELRRKPFTVDSLSGRQVTSASSQFSEVYEPIACSTSEAGYADSL